MRVSIHLSNVRDRSRWARERSRNLRASSQQLRDSLENLRVYGAEANRGTGGEQATSPRTQGGEPSFPVARTPLDFASLMRQRVHKARLEAQALRRRAADLRNQAVEFRARAQTLRRDTVIF